jgi:hypothetical protein
VALEVAHAVTDALIIPEFQSQAQDDDNQRNAQKLVSKVVKAVACQHHMRGRRSPDCDARLVCHYLPELFRTYPGLPLWSLIMVVVLSSATTPWRCAEKPEFLEAGPYRRIASATLKTVMRNIDDIALGPPPPGLDDAQDRFLSDLLGGDPRQSHRVSQVPDALWRPPPRDC